MGVDWTKTVTVHSPWSQTGLQGQICERINLLLLLNSYVTYATQGNLHLVLFTTCPARS